MMNAFIIILNFSTPSFLPFFELLSRFDDKQPPNEWKHFSWLSQIYIIKVDFVV